MQPPLVRAMQLAQSLEAQAQVVAGLIDAGDTYQVRDRVGVLLAQMGPLHAALGCEEEIPPAPTGRPRDPAATIAWRIERRANRIAALCRASYHPQARTLFPALLADVYALGAAVAP